MQHVAHEEEDKALGPSTDAVNGFLPHDQAKIRTALLAKAKCGAEREGLPWQEHSGTGGLAGRELHHRKEGEAQHDLEAIDATVVEPFARKGLEAEHAQERTQEHRNGLKGGCQANGARMYNIREQGSVSGMATVPHDLLHEEAKPKSSGRAADARQPAAQCRDHCKLGGHQDHGTPSAQSMLRSVRELSRERAK